MNKLLVLVWALAVCAGYAKLTPEQIERRKMEHFGGYVVQPVESKTIAVMVESKKAKPTIVAATVESMKMFLSFPIVIGDEKKAAVKIRIVENDGEGALTVRPEEATALVNITALAKDAPAEVLLSRRLTKEMWRALMYVLGSGNTLVGASVMKPIANLKELDEITSLQPSPEMFPIVKMTAEHLGVRPARRVTYRQACREGWAPSPSNEFQKNIWNKYHEIPTEPIKILPEKAKSK